MKKLIALVIAGLLLIGSTAFAASVKAVDGNSNIRRGPGLDYDEIGVLKKGTSATWLGDIEEDERGVDWYRISFKGKKGWVSSRYCDIVDSGYDDDDDDDDFDDDDDDIEVVTGDSVKITGGSVNLRKGPGLGYKSIVALKKGTTVAFLGYISTDSRGVDWYKVDTRYGVGWVSERYSRLDADDYEYISDSSNDDDDDFDDDDDEDDDYFTEQSSAEPISYEGTLFDNVNSPWECVLARTSGAVYNGDFNALESALNFEYGKTGNIVQMKNDTTQPDSFNFDGVPAGNLGGIRADIDRDGAYELIVAGQDAQRNLTIAVYEMHGKESVLADMCTLDVDVLPCINTAPSFGDRVDVFLFNDNHIGVAKFGVEGIRGDGTIVSFIDLKYNGLLNIAHSGTFSGSDWYGMDNCDLMNALRSCGITATMDNIMGGTVQIADLFTNKTMIGGMRSTNLLTFEQLGAGKTVARVDILNKDSALPVFTFEFS